MRTICDLIVYGEPAPQGSKNQFGGEASKKVKPWRERVAQVVGEAVSGLPLCRGAIEVRVTFAFARPKSHYRTGRYSRRLRDDAPVWHTSPNDLDKLQRAIGDALTGVVYADDKQIASWSSQKIYDERAYAHIQITDLAGGSHDTGRPGSPEPREDSHTYLRPAHPQVSGGV